MSTGNRILTSSPECLLFTAENERTRKANVVYFVYENNVFTGAHVSQDTIDVKDSTSVYECNKKNRESHRIF